MSSRVELALATMFADAREKAMLLGGLSGALGGDVPLFALPRPKVGG